jgi:hypothetical protein
MTCADSTGRTAIISGFRALTDYLESSSEVPTPFYRTIYLFPPDGDWTEKNAEIDAIAARLGVTTRDICGGYYIAIRSFGLVEYRAVATPHTCSEESE